MSRGAITLDRPRMELAKANLRRQLEQKLALAKAETAGKLRTVAGQIAGDLARRTFPSSQAIGLAVRSIRADVSRVYATGGRAYEILRETAGVAVAGQFYAAWKRGYIAGAERILRASGSPIRGIHIGALRPDLHDQARDPRTGRVMLRWPLQIVSTAERSAYQRLAQRRLGKTASGWAACAERLGATSGVPRWKSTGVHGSGGGSVRYRADGTGVWIVLINHRPLARKHISPGQVRRIVNPQRLLRLLAAR